MIRTHQVFLALMTAGLVAGCGSAQINRIDRNREAYESWPVDVKQAVLDGKVEVGMTAEMVRVSWGQPTEVINRSNTAGDEEIWIYRKGGDDGTMMVPAGGGTTMGSGIGLGGVGIGGGMGGGNGIGITTGRGGTGVYSTGGVGIGGGTIMSGPNIGMGGIGGVGTGMGSVPVVMTRPTPPEEKEVVFRNGVVYRADQP